jgi:hypothetical protein
MATGVPYSRFALWIAEMNSALIGVPCENAARFGVDWGIRAVITLSGEVDVTDAAELRNWSPHRCPGDAAPDGRPGRIEFCRSGTSAEAWKLRPAAPR